MAPEPSQPRFGKERLLKFLSDPKYYPDHPRHIQLLQTHISNVALTTRYAYKVKKAVNLGFLNFSTLEKRRHLCEQEVILNRRLSHGIYLGVVPIAMHTGSLVSNPWANSRIRSENAKAARSSALLADKLNYWPSVSRKAPSSFA